MSRLTRLQWWTRAFGGGLASLAVVGLVQFGSLLAADEAAKTEKPTRSFGFSRPGDKTEKKIAAFSRPATEKPVVKMHFSNTPWERVLRSVAKSSGFTITLQDVPPGTYSRPDFQKHTPTDAIRVLNNELEPIGFRILVKDQHVTVLDMQRARSTYRRPVSPETTTRRNAKSYQGPPTIDTVSAQRRQMKQRFETITGDLRRHRSVMQTSAVDGRGSIVRSGHEESAGVSSEQQPNHSGDNTFIDNTIIEDVYKARNRTAVDLAQTIYKSFKSRSQLLDEGKNGLPAFRVYRKTPTSQADNIFSADRTARNTWFTMEIDTDRNRLLIAAPRHTTRGLKTLVARLDVPPNGDKPVTKIVEGTESTVHVAKQLQPELVRLAGARQRQPAIADPRLGNAVGQKTRKPQDQFAWQKTDPPAQPGLQAPDDQPAQIQQKIPSALSGLRGEVTLEALDDLNLLILRGNEDDLRQVQEVIDMIEQLAVGTRPEIHLLFLQNVNSDALAVLLNDVYERLGNLRNVGSEQGDQTVNVLPVSTPNAILILAPTNAMESVIALAEELDQPGDPQSSIVTFPLKHAVATQVVDLLDDFYEERTGLGGRVKATADVRTNTVIISARPAELAEVELIIKRMDRNSSKSTNQIRVVPLEQAAADELADFLNETIQGVLNPPTQQGGQGGFGGANQGAQELRDTKAVVLEFLKRDGNAQQLIRSGLLSDVRVTADLRSNSLTVIAPEQTMKLILELIHVLDQPSAAIADIKVFQLRNADATAAVETLNEIFATDDEDQLGIAINGATDASSSLIPLKFSVDPRTNTVVAIGGLEALRVVEAILLRLDESDLRQRETVVVKLRNSRAEDVATAINDFVTAQLDLVQIDPDRISTGEIIDQTYIVVPEPATNTLLISASPRYFDDILRLTRELDVVPPQVFISALIVEVDLLDTDEWGVELGFQDPTLFTRSAADATTGLLSPGFLFNNTPLGNVLPFNGGDTGIVGAQGLSSFSLGRTNGDLGFGGLVLSASSDSVSVLLRALKARRNIRVLSAPKIHALDNQEAVIQDGQLVPIVNGVTTSGFTTTPQIIQQETGLILSVTPRITPEGEVVMGVSAQKSALSGATVPVFFDANTGTTINAPIIDQTIVTTTVMVNDGQTVVLGGIIVESDTVNERKVPYLGDLPYIGHAFRFDSNSHVRSELLVFLTPHIVHDDADFELIKQVETERVNFFEHEAEAVHGPLFSVPRPRGDILYKDDYGSMNRGAMRQDGFDPDAVRQDAFNPNVFDRGMPTPSVQPFEEPPFETESSQPEWDLEQTIPVDDSVIEPPPVPAEAGDADLQFLQ